MSKQKNNSDAHIPEWSKFCHSPFDWVLVAGLIGLLPLLAVHAGNLWSRPHFQFFPLAWASLVALVYLRGRLQTTNSAVRGWGGMLCYLASLAAGVIGILYFSPWFAHVGLTLLCLGWMSLRLGATAWHTCLGWVLLLVVTMPLPMNLDERLVQNLQSRSTRSASALLDLTSTPHLAMGNVLEIKPGKLFVDEACSGVDSLYALTAVALLLAIWGGHGLLNSSLTLLSVPMWAWLGNLMRIYIIAKVYVQFDTDWTHGWQHTMLGMLIFAGSVACLLATQSMLLKVFAPFPVKSITSGPVHNLYNVIVTWPRPNPTRRGSKSAPKVSPQVIELRRPALVKVLAMAFILCGVASVPPALGIGPWKTTAVMASQISEEAVENTFTAETLPAQLADMQQVGFEISHRQQDSIFGEHSATWIYLRGEHPVTISLDFPFPGFHALEVCYELSGSQFLEGVTEEIVADDQYISAGSMVDQFGEESYLCYTEFSSEGQSSSRNLGAARGVFKPLERSALFQMQILIPDAKQMSENDKAAYRRLLLDARELLLPQIQRLQSKEG